MNRYYKYILVIAVTLLIGAGIWYFQNIITYILISAVLSLIGTPVVHALRKIRLGKLILPRWLCAGITLLLIMCLLIGFFWFFVPVIAHEAQKFSSIDTNSIVASLNQPIDKVDQWINRMNVNNGKPFSTLGLISEKIQSVLNIGFLTGIFGSLASVVGNLFIAFFSVSFITFFFLKDEGLFGHAILLLTPTKYEAKVSEILTSTRTLLMRYFVGIGAQITGIMILLTIGLSVIGIDFQTSLVIALFAGIVNVIPYIGPLIGTVFGIILGVASRIQFVSPGHLLPYILLIGFVFLCVHLIDNIIFQPLIYSSSVRAHPLEIFLVILVAGHFAGIAGMLVAIPGYTVFRVIAKQFLNNFKVVKKLTEKI